MKSKDTFALLSLILGVVGGLLLIKIVIDAVPRLLEGRGQINIDLLVTVGIGLIAIVASFMVWKGSYSLGGLINVILGVVAILYGRDTAGVIILISGILGVAAPRIKD
jgi:hypothetical protein